MIQIKPLFSKALKYFAEEWLPELAVGQIEKQNILSGIAKMTGAKKGPDGAPAKEPVGEKPKVENIKFGGILNVSDSTALFDIYGQLEEKFPGKGYTAKIAKFITDNYPDEGDRKNIRITIDRLALLSYTVESEKKITKIPQKKKAQTGKQDAQEPQELPPIIQEMIGKPVTINPAVRFLAAFAELDDADKKNVLVTSGVLVSDLEIAFKKADKKAGDLAQTVKKLRCSLREPKEEAGLPARRYKGAIREALGLGNFKLRMPFTSKP